MNLEEVLGQKIQDLKKKLMEIQIGNSQSERDFSLQSPFSQQILDKPVPIRFKMSAVELFDGSTDPLDYLEDFRAIMRLQGTSDALLHITFLITLKKFARI